MKKANITRIASAIMVAIMLFCAAGNTAQAKDKFKVAVSIYAGWMPWYYAKESGIMDKWAKAKGIEVEIQYMDYVPSIEAYVAQKVDAVVATNMETLDMPAAAGIDSTAIIMGDFSNDNDQVLGRDGLTITNLKGKTVFLVQNSVSHYLLVRGLEKNGLKESDVKIVNTSDADIAPAFISNEDQKVVVTWNPMVMQIAQVPGVMRMFGSADIPGEIQDLCVVNTDVLKADPRFGEALVGCWYEVLGIMQQRGPTADKAMSKMAKLAGCSATEYKQQLKTTAMFWTPQNAIAFTAGPEVKQKMETVRQFCFAHKLLGENAKSVDEVGIEYPDGSVQGSKANVKFRFTTKFMELAANGKLSAK